MMRRPCGRAFGLLATVALATVAASSCHDEGDVRVSSLTFEGNHVFSSSRLANVFLTRAGGWLPWSRPRYFNRAVFDADLDRLTAFYEDRGYPDARPASVDVDFNAKRDAVRLRIHLDEGAPLIVERVAFTGFDGAPKEVTDALSGLPLQPGAPRDRQVVAASRERVTFLLRDHGHPHARVESREDAGSQPRHVVVTIAATPGPQAHFGPISVVGLASVHESLVRRTLAFDTGELYRESLVRESQRRLGKLGIFEFAHVRADLRAESTAATNLPMAVTLSEGRPTRLQLGIGYGSEDGPRRSARWEHLNFLGDARRFSAEAKYSARLRGVGLEFVQPYFLTPTVKAVKEVASNCAAGR